ncbi:MAG: CidA/LrgA family protein [Pseudomonadota bacterium]
MLNWFTLILVCQLAGELLIVGTGLPLPGPVIGMLLLFGILLVVGNVSDQLARTGDFLLSNLALLFVPAGVGVMVHYQLLKNDWPAISISLVASTLITIAVTALVMIGLKRLTGKYAQTAENDGNS